MIRVLEVLATLKRAGAERVAVSLACGLDRSRFETAVVSLYDAFPEGFEPELAAAGVPAFHLGKRRGFDPRMWTRLREVVRKFKPDIIHTHSYVLRYALAAGSGRFVHTVHNLAAREVDTLGRMIQRVAFRRGVVPVAVSDAVARSIANEYAVQPAVILNGIDLERFRTAQNRTAWRRANGFEPDDVLVVSVARLDPQKNPLGLLHAFKQAGTRAHLLFVGRGSLEHRIGGPLVHKLGVRTDIPELLMAADVFTLASDWEGHPLAVIEAMAAGLPVVATAVGGVPEIVGDAGLLVAAGDTNAFAEGLREVITNPDRRRTLGRAAVERARLFDVRTMIDEYSHLFETMVNRCA